MQWWELTIPEHLTQRRGDVHRELVGDQTLVTAYRWNALEGRLDVKLVELSGQELTGWEPVLLWRNLTSDKDRIPGWQLIASRADGKRTYTRDEIPQLIMRLGIPETTAEINEAPILTVGV